MLDKAKQQDKRTNPILDKNEVNNLAFDNSWDLIWSCEIAFLVADKLMQPKGHTMPYTPATN